MVHGKCITFTSRWFWHIIIPPSIVTYNIFMFFFCIHRVWILVSHLQFQCHCSVLITCPYHWQSAINWWFCLVSASVTGVFLLCFRRTQASWWDAMWAMSARCWPSVSCSGWSPQSCWSRQQCSTSRSTTAWCLPCWSHCLSTSSSGEHLVGIHAAS